MKKMSEMCDKCDKCDSKNCSCPCHNMGCCKGKCCSGAYSGMNNGGGAVYGLGVIGAAIYFISTATGFWMGVLGLLKAIIWPVFMVFELLKFLIG